MKAELLLNNPCALIHLTLLLLPNEVRLFTSYFYGLFPVYESLEQFQQRKKKNLRETSIKYQAIFYSFEQKFKKIRTGTILIVTYFTAVLFTFEPSSRPPPQKNPSAVMENSYRQAETSKSESNKFFEHCCFENIRFGRLHHDVGWKRESSHQVLDFR